MFRHNVFTASLFVQISKQSFQNVDSIKPAYSAYCLLKQTC